MDTKSDQAPEQIALELLKSSNIQDRINAVHYFANEKILLTAVSTLTKPRHDNPLLTAILRAPQVTANVLRPVLVLSPEWHIDYYLNDQLFDRVADVPLLYQAIFHRSEFIRCMGARHVAAPPALLLVAARDCSKLIKNIAFNHVNATAIVKQLARQ